MRDLGHAAGRFGPLLVLLLLAVGAPSTVGAQEGEPLALELLDDGQVRVVLGDFLAETGPARSLEAGLPVRIQLVVELWRDRFFDSQDGRYEWRGAIRYDPLTETYRIETEEEGVAQVESTTEAAGAVREMISIPLAPELPGEYYYLANLELASVSESDLEELRRWLRGDLAPALGGDEEVGSALGRGARRFFLRILGLPSERMDARTPRFIWEE